MLIKLQNNYQMIKQIKKISIKQKLYKISNKNHQSPNTVHKITNLLNT